MLEIILIILFLIFLGLIIFAIFSGIGMFNQIFLRKKDDESLNPNVIKNSLEQMKNSALGTSLEGIKMEGAGNLASHLNDKKIMIPLLEKKLYWFDLLNNNEKIQKVSIIGTKGKKLQGYYIKAEENPLKKNCLAIIVHGYTDSGIGMAYLAEDYLSRGISILTVDCRAHGYSEGKYITMGYTDSKDVLKWLKFAINQENKNCNFILHGVSMGAATVIQTLSLKGTQQVTPKISLVVGDCGFSSAKDQMSLQINQFFGKNLFQKFIGKIIFLGLSFVNFFKSGFFLGWDSPKKALKKRQKMNCAKVPVILFHGEKDSFVPLNMLESLEKASGNKNISIIKVKDAPHIGCYFYEPEKYMESIMKVAKI